MHICDPVRAWCEHLTTDSIHNTSGEQRQPARRPLDYVNYLRYQATLSAGTHDNSTTAGWWADDANENDRKLIKAYAGVDGKDIAWAMIRIGMCSVAKTTIFTMQVGHQVLLQLVSRRLPR